MQWNNRKNICNYVRYRVESVRVAALRLNERNKMNKKQFKSLIIELATPNKYSMVVSREYIMEVIKLNYKK